MSVRQNCIARPRVGVSAAGLICRPAIRVPCQAAGNYYFAAQTRAALNKKQQTKRKEDNMKKQMRHIALTALLVLGVAPAANLRAADSAERATAAKEKIEELRVECAKVRNQVLLTMESLKRMNVKGVELRPQFEKFKAELVTMEEQAKVTRARADAMKEKGQAAFAAWEKEVQAINNADIRKEAEKRFDKRKKSYDKIIKAIWEAETSWCLSCRT